MIRARRSNRIYISACSRRAPEMLPLIFTDHAAAAIFAAACLAWLVPEWLGGLGQLARGAPPAAQSADAGSLGVLIGLQWLGLALNFALAAFVPGAALTWMPRAVFAAGIALMLLGVALRVLAVWTLGRYFTRHVAVASDQPVVERGLYRHIRHPAYSGTLLTMLGLGLASGNAAGLAVLMAGTLAGHLYRVRVEEAALVRAIGAPYRAYQQRTWRFIPWVY
jgi:protein-S-isoprenylcysteine O-methyltransferase